MLKPEDLYVLEKLCARLSPSVFFLGTITPSVSPKNCLRSYNFLSFVCLL